MSTLITLLVKLPALWITWVLAKLAVPTFPVEHPWLQKEQFFTFQEWCEGATPLLLEMGVCLYLCFVGIAACIMIGVFRWVA